MIEAPTSRRISSDDDDYLEKCKYFYLDALKFLLMNLDIELPSVLKLERRLVLEISDSKEVSCDGDNTGAELYDFLLKNTFQVLIKNYWICFN